MAREKLMKMLAKKKDLSPHEKHAKMSVVKDLKDSVSDMMGDKMDGLKKVSVMSNSSEGLRKGLEKARGVLSGSEEHQMREDAEAPYADAKMANQEHQGEDQSDNMGQPHGFSEGGEIQDPPDQGDYSDVDPSDDNDGSEEESPDHQPEDYVQEAQSPAGHEESGEDDDTEFEGLDMDEIHKKLQKLMDLKSKMESR